VLPNLVDTLRRPVPIGEHTIPKPVLGLDLTTKSIHPFEAYVASLVDGHHEVRELAAAAALGLSELEAVLWSLAQQGVIEVDQRRPRPPETEELPVRRAIELKTVSRPELPERAPDPPRAKAPGGSAEPPRLAQVPQDAQPAAILSRAGEHERAGDIEGALEILRRGIDRVRSPAPLHNRFALLLANHQRLYGEAEQHLRLALKLEPNNVVYNANLLKVLMVAASRPEGASKGMLGRLRARPPR
jgi:type IV pilus assembly protein PilB